MKNRVKNHLMPCILQGFLQLTLLSLKVRLGRKKCSCTTVSIGRMFACWIWLLFYRFIAWNRTLSEKSGILWPETMFLEDYM